jgi:DNA-binding protein H-NS
MATLKDLLSQIESLQGQVAEVRQREVGEAIAKVRSIMDEYQLSIADVFPSSRAPKGLTAKKAGSKVAAKYRDPLSGKTWSGRGLAPKWLAGKNKDDYLIKG